MFYMVASVENSFWSDNKGEFGSHLFATRFQYEIDALESIKNEASYHLPCFIIEVYDNLN
jgi:hypothetical protein